MPTNKIDIQLDSLLDLTKNKVDIAQFDAFEEKTAPMYGNAISNIFSETIENEGLTIYNTKGDSFRVQDQVLYKNNEPIMETEGTGYFTQEKIDSLDEYDTYAEEDGNVVKSKYTQGLIEYWFNDDYYSFTVSNPTNAIINCRSRLINGTPITAYVFATPVEGQYEFVYLSAGIEKSYIGTVGNLFVSTDYELGKPAGTDSSLKYVQPSGSTVIKIKEQDIKAGGGKGFQNALIQIANPIDGIYTVSFLTNHGGKIDPSTDLEFFNILYNHSTNTFYNNIQWNRDSTVIEIPQEKNISVLVKPKVTQSEVTGTCYTYLIPSGNDVYDSLHASDAGRYFKTIDRYGELVDEILFDEGYEPTYSSQTTDYMENSAGDNVSYVKYQTFNYTTHNDILTIDGELVNFDGDSISIDLPFTKKIKHRDIQEHIYPQYKVEVPNQVVYNEDLESIGNKHQLVQRTGTDPNNPDTYRYKIQSTFPNTIFNSTDYYIPASTGATYLATDKWRISTPAVVGLEYPVYISNLTQEESANTTCVKIKVTYHANRTDNYLYKDSAGNYYDNEALTIPHRFHIDEHMSNVTYSETVVSGAVTRYNVNVQYDYENEFIKFRNGNNYYNDAKFTQSFTGRPPVGSVSSYVVTVLETIPTVNLKNTYDYERTDPGLYFNSNNNTYYDNEGLTQVHDFRIPSTATGVTYTRVVNGNAFDVTVTYHDVETIPGLFKNGNYYIDYEETKEYTFEKKYYIYSTEPAYTYYTDAWGEDDYFEIDSSGNPLPIDFTYIRNLYNFSTSISPALTYESASYNTQYDRVDSVIQTLTQSFFRDYYYTSTITRWTDEDDSFHYEGDSNWSWTFTYENNSTNWGTGFLFGGFNNDLTGSLTIKEGEHYITDNVTFGTLDVTGNDVNFSKRYTWNEQQESTQVIFPTVIFDNGKAYSTAALQESPNDRKYFVLPLGNTLAFEGTVTSCTDNELTYTVTGFYNTGDASTERVCLTQTIDLNINYFRECLNMANGTNSTATTVTELNILYDSLSGTYADAGFLTDEATTGSGWLTAHIYNVQGSLAPLNDNIRLCINSGGLISNISWGRKEYIGTLLTEWNAVSEDKYFSYENNGLIYKSTDNNWYRIRFNEGTDEKLRIIFDRYIIVNTEGFWNCYDDQNNKPAHYATDYNNRALAGVSSSYSNYINIAKENAIGPTLVKYFVSGQNALYEVSGDSLTSIQLSPIPYSGIAFGYETFPWTKCSAKYKPQYIELFEGSSTDSTTATYVYSNINYELTSIRVKDSSLVGLNSPLAVSAATTYTPNLFTEFIKTYNNKDLVKNGLFAYPLVYSETTPIFNYSSAKQLTNVDAIFVIQSQFYALINGKIVSVVYDNYSILSTDAIIDVTGMVFIGYLPTSAYFWSPANHSIYTFTGDANLSLAFEANGINEVYNTFYSTEKESIFLTTDKGIYIFSDQQQWHLPYTNIENIYFIRDGYFIVETDDYVSRKIAFEKNLLNNPEKLRTTVTTKFFGYGNGQISTTNKIQFILRVDKPYTSGEVILSCATMTDTGFESEEKRYKIKATDFSPLTDALVLNYTPKYQTGLGFKFSIQSDFDIVKMTMSSIQKQGTQSTRNNA